MLLLMLFAAGCIVADPPSYRDATQTPPFLDLAQAVPTLSRVLVVNTSNAQGTAQPPVDFSIPVRSEDAGDRLVAALHLDYGIVSLPESFQALTVNPPSAFDDTGRSIKIPWVVRNNPSPGCHVLTLVVSHLSTFDLPSGQPDPQRAAHDQARATWWVNVNPPTSEPGTLVSCPTRETQP